jgi:hypothetical protein
VEAVVESPCNVADDPLHSMLCSVVGHCMNRLT